MLNLFGTMLQTATLLNGSFERASIEGWIQNSYGASPKVSLSCGAHSGKGALYASSEDPTDTAFGQDISVKPGVMYVLSGWVRTKRLDPMGSPVFGTIQVQGAGSNASGANHLGDTPWTKESVYFVGPPSGKIRVALFFCGWGKGTGEAWFDDIEVKPVSQRSATIKITKQPLVRGRISPLQYGQFIEYLCDLVPAMWAEKLYDGSFEGLSPYKFEYIRATDFKEIAWRASTRGDATKVEDDAATAVSGPTSKRLTVPIGDLSYASISQDGISLNKGVACTFSVYAKADRPNSLTVGLYKGEEVLDVRTLPVGTTWKKVTTALRSGITTTNATLSVRFDRPGIGWLDSASLMPADNIGGWRKDVVAALKALKPGIVRIGGSVLDDPNLGTFEWTDTIGDPDRRTPFRAWGGLQPTGPGMEEIVQLIKGVGAEPLICLRYERKTPKDAADEVEYFNGSTATPMGALRARNGHPKPYDIKYWQIGNERWGETYWRDLPQFARAIRKVDPSVKLLSSFPSEELLRSAGGDIDFVSPHQYDIADLGGSRRELQAARAMVAKYKLKAAVTEWNTTAGDAGLGRAKLWNLGNALACSRYHNLLHREADLVEIANRSNLANSFCSGIIQTSRSAMYLTPTYYTQQLYATLAGTRPLRIDSSLPTDLSPDLSATLSEDGRWLTLFAVNDQPIIVTRQIDLTEIGNYRLGLDVYELKDSKNQGSLEATNSFDAPNRIVPLRRTFVARSAKFDYVFPPQSLTVLRVWLGGIGGK